LNIGSEILSNKKRPFGFSRAQTHLSGITGENCYASATPAELSASVSAEVKSRPVLKPDGQGGKGYAAS